jgi:ferredoxin--NADP+ reductase
MPKPLAYNARIVGRDDLHRNLMMIAVQPDAGPFPAFRPGQFVSVGRLVESNGVTEMVTRSYSIGSSADARSSVELFVVHVDDGEFTSWLFEQRVGSHVWLSPRASGGFTLEGVPADRDMVFVSTGTALAPYVSMLRTVGGNPPWRRAVLINGVRHANDLGYRAELERVAARDARFTYLPMVTREPAGSGWKGLRGRVGDVMEPDRFRQVTGFDLDPASCHVFLCGNPLMVEDLEASLRTRGFRKHTRHTPGSLHLEKYWSD